MSSNWTLKNIGDLVESISERNKNKLVKVVTVNTSDVLNGKVLNHKLISNSNLKGQFKKIFRENDILFSEIRPNNRRFAFIDFDPKGYIASTKLMVLRTKCGHDSRFIYFLLTSNEMINKFQELAESRSGTFPQITFSEIENFNVLIPQNINEQKAIADTLSCLDEKIELNNKINKNLEEIAKALFKSWFIDFEPFKDGEFVDSELGKIPKGWKVKELREVCTCVLGGTPNRKNNSYWDGNIPWINSGKINDYRIVEPTEYITKEGLTKSATKLLPEKTVVLAITGATLGQYSILEIESCTNQSVVGILENKGIQSCFVYLTIKNKGQSQILCDLVFLIYFCLLILKIFKKKYSSSGYPYPCLLSVFIFWFIPSILPEDI